MSCIQRWDDRVDAIKMRTMVASFYLNPKYSDLTITCGAESFPAHRNIVCPQSAYFASLCEGRFKEASSGEVKIGGGPILMKNILEYLYKGDYTTQDVTFRDTADTMTKSSDNQPLAKRRRTMATSGSGLSPPSTYNGFMCQFHVQMYAEGDYFQIDGLKTLAKKNIAALFPKLSTRESFEAAVLEVYRSTPEQDKDLRTLVIKLVMDNLKTLRSGPRPPLDNQLLEDEPRFAGDLCVALLDKRRTRKTSERMITAGY